jgi:bifunctional DNA-binding transcriptional regulator/antitoxin component of YhaV-PrlF toxin-antitoxin module
MANLTVGRGGEIVLPDPVRDRYGLAPDTPVRIVETRSGILLVPLTDEPMSAELEQELEEWQSLSLQTWEMFPYEDDAQ